MRRAKPPMPSSIVFRRNPARHLLFFSVVLVLAGTAVCDRTLRKATKTDDQATYHDKSFAVARVIDGDTLDIAAPDGAKPTTRIRLWGVDCPEVGHGGKPSHHFGPQASRFATDTLAGKTVHLLLADHQTRGKYGRLLAYVHMARGGDAFNEMLLRSGHAYADYRFQHALYERYGAIEKRARKAGVGLWKDVTPEQMPAWRQRWERRTSNRD